MSLSKLREYHGSLKSICVEQSIDLRDFEQIFGSSDGFAIWDDDKNNLIDALELFSGLILFSVAKFEDKIRCSATHDPVLFDLFDFNELNSLAITDVKFMLSCCITSTYRIHKITTEHNEEELDRFVVDNFNDEARVNISQLIKWCCQNAHIKEFFTVIKKEMPEIREGALNPTVVDGKLIDNIFRQTTSTKPFEPIDSGYLLASKEYKQKISWMASIAKKLHNTYESNSSRAS